MRSRPTWISDVGLGDEVVEPPRVLGRAALRRDYHVCVAVPHVEQRRGAGLLGAAPDGAQEQHRPATEARANPSVALLVEPLVHGEQRAKDEFEEWVHAGHPSPADVKLKGVVPDTAYRFAVHVRGGVATAPAIANSGVAWPALGYLKSSVNRTC